MKEIISSLCFKNVLIEWIDGAKVEFDGKYFLGMLILRCHSFGKCLFSSQCLLSRIWGNLFPKYLATLHEAFKIIGLSAFVKNMHTYSTLVWKQVSWNLLSTISDVFYCQIFLNFQNRSNFTIQTADFKFVGFTQIWFKAKFVARALDQFQPNLVWMHLLTVENIW